MASAQSNTSSARHGHSRQKRSTIRRLPLKPGHATGSLVVAILLFVAGAFLVYWAFDIHAHYALSLQSPVKVHLQWPFVVERRSNSEAEYGAQLDQHRPLTAYQQYTCRKFGSACRVALAIQRAENPQGKCEIYHYNADGTLDWGYFQINTVHLKREGVNLRDLLDCRANIDFAYQIYAERQNFSAWRTYTSGAYRKFLIR